MTGVLAMFPLGSVLLPGEALPLQVFEPRYRRLVVDLLEDDEHDPEFGVTLIERGHEVGGGDQRAAVGTVARIAQIEAQPGGRYRLLAVGTTRLRVERWLADDPYPRAEVSAWPDEEVDVPALTDRVAATQARLRATHRLAAELGEPLPSADVDLGDDPVLASYHLVSLAPLGPADRYRLLATPTPAARLDVLEQVLDDVDAMLRFRHT